MFYLSFPLYFSSSFVLGIYYSITNYHRPSSLKQCNVLSHSFCGSAVWHTLAASSTWGLTNLQSRCWPGIGSHLERFFRQGRNSFPWPPRFFGRIQFLMIVGLKHLASFWLSAGGCPQLLDATSSSWLCRLPQNVCLTLSSQQEEPPSMSATKITLLGKVT